MNSKGGIPAPLETPISNLSYFLNVTTVDDELYSGNIHYYDSEKSIVVLKKFTQEIRDIEKNHSNYHVINLKHVKKWDIQQNQDIQEILKSCLQIDLNLEDALQREAGIELQTQEQTYQTQAFQKLQQMYGASYKNKDEIFIPDLSITIKSPFKSENVSGGEQIPVERVKKILDALLKEN